MSAVEIAVWAVFFACALAGVAGMHVWTYWKLRRNCGNNGRRS